jgi:hypothetical protein
MSNLGTQVTLATTHLWPMFPVFLDYSLLITLCVLFNVYLLQSVQCVVANVTFVPRLLIVDYPLCFCLRFIYYSLFSELWLATTH